MQQSRALPDSLELRGPETKKQCKESEEAGGKVNGKVETNVRRIKKEEAWLKKEDHDLPFDVTFFKELDMGNVYITFEKDLVLEVFPVFFCLYCRRGMALLSWRFGGKIFCVP